MKEVWDSEHRVPYAYDAKEWVGYDNVKSIEGKVRS